MRNFVKLQKYAFLKQNNFMRIDELPYHSSLFYEAVFHKHWKIPLKNAKSAK